MENIFTVHIEEGFPISSIPALIDLFLRHYHCNNFDIEKALEATRENIADNLGALTKMKKPKVDIERIMVEDIMSGLKTMVSEMGILELYKIHFEINEMGMSWGLRRRLIMSKSTAQQIADLQNKLQALRTKKARQDRREETRQKIILGAEVAKVLNSKPEEVNKALLLGLLSKIKELDEEEKRDFTRIGMNILEEWKNENRKP